MGVPLTPGDHLGPYEILSPLGAGGMGEVYRARDTKLNRDVAIKVLPAGLANDADYLARFQREAQALAALHHPNIATIFGLEQNAIVMELVEGQNPKGPLPLNEALNVARQIAEALEAAHDKGIIHRDLKPGNIIVTPDGVVKVLDFGLAKTAEKSNGPTTADSPTLTMRATVAGLILGTAGYMSPEQAAGKPVDRRADIWSFGVVLHELLTGKRLFHGETVSHTLAHVFTTDIDLTKIPGGPIRELVKRCLDRNLKNRLQHIGEARIAIESYLANPNEATPAPTQTSRWPWAFAALLLLTTIAGWGAFLRKPNQPAPLVKFDVNPPDGSRFSASAGSAISPDGRTLAFVVTNAKGEALLHVRPLDSLEARALPGTEGAGRPFWSPDSKSLAFVAKENLRRIDLAGGAPLKLCEVLGDRGGTWNDDGVILFGSQRAALQRIPASGGTPSPVTRFDQEAGETAHYYPQFLPGGKEFLYLGRHANTEKTGIYVGSLDGRAATRLVQTEYKAVYDAVAERLLYIQGEDTLMARRLELNPPRLTGNPAVVAEQVGRVFENGFANVSVSVNGTVFYGQGRNAQKVRFGWRDRAGKLLETVGQPVESPRQFALSPDGSRVAYSAGEGQPDIWVLDLRRGVSTRASFSKGQWPQWSPDGKQLYYRNPTGIHRKSADGSGDEELLRKRTEAADVPLSVSPDGKHLLFGSGDIMTLPLTAEREPEPYLQTQYGEFAATFSPDGRWVAYHSDESRRMEIYVQGFPERRGKWPVSSAGGRVPQWCADGKELYWVGQGNVLMAASVDLQATGVRVGPAVPLFKLSSGSYRPAPDGRRFLVLEPEGGQQPCRPMVVIQNWAAVLAK